MGNLRKAIAAIGVAAILSTLVVSTAVAATFTDVPATAWYYESVEGLGAAGVIDTTKTTYRPADNMTRAEAAKLLVESAGLTATLPDVATFTDVPKTAWYFQYAETANANGVASGNGTLWRPNDKVTRAEFAKMVVEAYNLDLVTPEVGSFSDVAKTAWYYTYMESAVEAGVMTGYPNGTAAPAKNIVRAEGAAMTYRAMTPVVADDDDDDDDDDGGLEGGAGSVEEYKLVTSYQNEEVGEGEDDVIVYGMTIEADDSSDLNIAAMRLVFDETGAGGSDTSWHDFDKYAEDVSVWYEDEEVARVDGDVFTDDNNWTKTISFDQNAIVRAGEVGNFYVAITGVDNLDSADETDSWTLDVTSVRFEDAQDAVISEDPTLDARTLSFESFATAADTQFKVSTGDETINDAHVVDIDDVDDTPNVELLSVNFEVEGSSDLNLKKLPVNFYLLDASTTAANVDDIATSFQLLIDGEEVSSVTVGSGTDCVEDANCVDVGYTETYVFQDIDTILEAGETYDVTVTGKINDTDASFVDGDSMGAKILNSILDDDGTYNPDNDGDGAGDGAVAAGTYTGTNGFDLEDEEGNNLADADTTGSVTGDRIAFRDTGIQVAFISSSYDKNASEVVDETVEFGLVFDVTAFGDDMYVDKTCIVGTTGADVDQIEVSLDGANNDGTNETCTDISATGDEKTNSWEVKEGETERFTVTVLGSADEASGAGQSITYTARINGIGYKPTSDGQGTVVYAYNLDDYHSAAVTVFERV